MAMFRKLWPDLDRQRFLEKLGFEIIILKLFSQPFSSPVGYRNHFSSGIPRLGKSWRKFCAKIMAMELLFSCSFSDLERQKFLEKCESDQQVFESFCFIISSAFFQWDTGIRQRIKPFLMKTCKPTKNSPNFSSFSSVNKKVLGLVSHKQIKKWKKSQHFHNFFSDY